VSTSALPIRTRPAVPKAARGLDVHAGQVEVDVVKDHVGAAEGRLDHLVEVVVDLLGIVAVAAGHRVAGVPRRSGVTTNKRNHDFCQHADALTSISSDRPNVRAMTIRDER
jgi:hypothetical protein